MIDKFTADDRDVLLIVDIQNDFCPGGNLPVPRGDEVVPLINGLARRFTPVVLTQDWHPRGLCVPNIRFGMDAENRRGKLAT